MGFFITILNSKLQLQQAPTHGRSNSYLKFEIVMRVNIFRHLHNLNVM